MYHRPLAEFTRRAARFGSPSSSPSASSSSHQARAATQAIAATAYQKNAVREAQEELRKIGHQEQQRATEKKRKNNNNNFTSLLNLVGADSATQTINPVRSKEIVKLAKRIGQPSSTQSINKSNTDDDDALRQLLKDIDELAVRFCSDTESRRSVPDEFCRIVAECTRHLMMTKSKNDDDGDGRSTSSSASVSKNLFNRYRELMSPAQQIKFGW